MENDKLQHAGIKGMRWGRRRYQNKDGSLTPEGRKRYGLDNDNANHDDHNRARSKSASSMSDKELNDAVVRLQREKLYKELTASKATKGQKFVDKLTDKMIETSVDIAAKNIARPIMEAGVDVASRKTKAGIGRTAKGRKFLRDWGFLN